MPNPNEDNPIQKLWEYIPPYTTPNYPPHVEVITTTNTGDTPMTDPLDRMRTESDWLKAELTLRAEVERLRKERDEARRMLCEEWAQQDGLPLDGRAGVAQRAWQSSSSGTAIRKTRRTLMAKTKNKTVKTDTETITKISDFVWELSTEMDAIREQMEDLQIRMLSIRKMLQIMENPKNN